MKSLINFIKLFTGLFLYAVGIVITINANNGLAPWDIFHQGLALQMHITMGQAGIGVGFILIVINFIFGERIGLGTIGNMFFVGYFLDILIANHWIPVIEEGLFLQFAMMSLGLFIIGVASVFYIGTGLGAGPRDGLMVILTKKTGKSVQFVRNAIEVVVLIFGFFLGGSLGLGTVYMSLSVGFFVQLAFKIFHFNVNTVQHRFIDEDIRWLKYKLLALKKKKSYD
ncbi:MAG: YczE/YyaS/YitT family protein [Eubacteriales bacterium]